MRAAGLALLFAAGCHLPGGGNVFGDGGVLGGGNGHWNAVTTMLTADSPAGQLPLLLGGDFTGDGKADVVYGVGAKQVIRLLPGKGDGTFGVPVDVVGPSADAAPLLDRFAAADFNHDGSLDLVIAIAQGHDVFAQVFTNDGHGSFTGGALVDVQGCPQMAGILAAIGGLVPVDLRATGAPDLAAFEAIEGCLSNQTYGIRVLPNGGGVLGMGAFQANPDETIVFARVADLNGDGKQDVIGWTGAAVDALLAPALARSASISSRNGIGNPDGPNFAVADFNGDGKMDLAWGKHLLLGKGDGTFDDTIGTDVGNSPVVADFNSDGHPDLANIDSVAITVALYLP